MELPTPEPASMMPRGGIRKPLLRILACIAAILAISTVLYAVPLRDRALTASLTFLLIVLIVSAFWGFRYAVFVLFLTALGFAWLLPPVGYFWLNDPRDVFTLAAFLVIGITASRFSERARREALSANQRHAEAVAAQERFRAYVDHATDALLVHDDRGRIIDANREACESLGYTREELIGRGARDFDDVDAEFIEWIRSRLEAGEVVNFETSRRRKNGTVFPVEVRVRPFWHGGHRYALGLARDITDRKRAEQAREEIEEQWRAAFESNPTMYFIVDEAGNIASVNSFGAQQLGYSNP